MKRRDEKVLNFESDISVNPNDMFNELLRHPQLCYDYGRAKAVAEKKMNNAEQEVKIIKAEVADRVRNNPEKYRLIPDKNGKVAETAIKLMIDKSPEKSEAKKRYHQAIFDYQVLSVAYECFTWQRRMALERASEMLIRGLVGDIEIRAPEKVEKILSDMASDAIDKYCEARTLRHNKRR